MSSTDVGLHHDIVERCKTGDSNAQYQLYQLYSKAMFNICLRITNDREEAEDVLQEAFMSVFSKINSYRKEATVGAWIKRIVINGAINHIKKRKIDTLSMDERPIPDQAAHEDLDWTDQMLQVEKIKGAMAVLPDGYRMVFSLYLLDGYDHKEIAEILEIAESTSKSQFNRAKNKIREILVNEVNYG